MREEFRNISCREIHETNIGHEARNYKHLMPGKYRKQTSAMRQKIKNIPCGKHNLNNCHEIRREHARRRAIKTETELERMRLKR